MLVNIRFHIRNWCLNHVGVSLQYRTSQQGADNPIKNLIWDDWRFLEAGDIFFLWGSVGGISSRLAHVLILLHFAVLWYRLSKLWLTSTYVGSHYVEEFYFCSKTIHSGILTTEEQLFFVVGWILNNIFSQMNVERLLSSKQWLTVCNTLALDNRLKKLLIPNQKNEYLRTNVCWSQSVCQQLWQSCRLSQCSTKQQG